MRRGGRLLLTTREAAQAVGVSPATLRDWARRGVVSPVMRDRWDMLEVHRASAAPKPRRRLDPDPRP